MRCALATCLVHERARDDGAKHVHNTHSCRCERFAANTSIAEHFGGEVDDGVDSRELLEQEE